MTTRLQLYNDALTNCGEEHLANLSENSKPRRLLDHVWNNGGVNFCLEQAPWRFATNTIQIDSDSTITIEYGYNYGFQKPSDWLVTAAISSEESFNTPLTQVIDENGYWYADIDPIYVRYVSSGANYGGDLTIWPDIFRDYVAAYFARRIVLSLTGNRELKNDMVALEAETRRDAKNHNMKSAPTRFPPSGSWSSSRRGSSRYDRGNTGNLIG